MSREEISDLADFYYTVLKPTTAKMMVEHLVRYANLK